MTTEAELAGTALPIDTVMCTVELARRLKLGLDNLRLETLARHWDISQTRAHDAFDDALVLSGCSARPCSGPRARHLAAGAAGHRRRWPNGRVTHDELRPLKTLASRMPCPYLNPGRYQGTQLVQGMRVALSSEVQRTHEELVERILHAGLAYTEGRRPADLPGGVQRARARAGQGLPGPRTRCAGGLRRAVHGQRRVGRPRHRHRRLRPVGGPGPTVRPVLTPTMSSELSADDVRGVVFAKSGVGRRGYDPKSVQELLQLAARRLDGRGYLRADDVRRQAAHVVGVQPRL